MSIAPGLESHINQHLQQPIQESRLHIKGLGAIIMTSNSNSIDVEKAVSSLITPDGAYTNLTLIDGHAYEVPGQDLVVREQTVDGDTEYLHAAVQQYAQEINVLRGLGLRVVEHASAIVPIRGLTSSTDRAQQQSTIITIAQKLPGQTPHGLSIKDPANTSLVKNITSTLQTYYTHDITRPHISDISHRSQYSTDGQLLDLDMNTTDPVGTDLTKDYSTCGAQLRDMYKDFELSDDQIAQLKKDYSISRQSITITRPPQDKQKKSSGSAKDRTPEEISRLSEVIRGMRAAQAKAEAAVKAFSLAEDYANNAETILFYIPEEDWRHAYSDSVQVRQNFDTAARGAEANVLTLQNLTDRIDEIVERL